MWKLSELSQKAMRGRISESNTLSISVGMGTSKRGLEAVSGRQKGKNTPHLRCFGYNDIHIEFGTVEELKKAGYFVDVSDVLKKIKKKDKKMEKVVFKYKISMKDVGFSLWLPKGAKFLKVAKQFEDVVAWFELSVHIRPELRTFRVMATGEPFDSVKWNKHLGTFLIDDGRYVFHLYEDTKSKTITQERKEYLDNE